MQATQCKIGKRKRKYVQYAEREILDLVELNIGTSLNLSKLSRGQIISLREIAKRGAKWRNKMKKSAKELGIEIEEGL